MYTRKIAEPVSFSEYLNTFKKTIKRLFNEKSNTEKLIQTRGFPPMVLQDIMTTKPLSVEFQKNMVDEELK